MKVVVTMNFRSTLFVFWMAFLPALIGDISWAGFQFLDPEIPNGETITYRSQSEGKTIIMEEQIILISEGQKTLYEISSRSPALDTYIRIDRKDMTVSSVHTIQKYDAATLDSKLIIRDTKPNTRDDAVTVPHFVALTHLLRGFPFESKNKISIRYYGGSGGGKFNLCVRNKDRERVKINGRDIECYKLEFGIDGFFATILPELELWYTVKPPHYMVMYKGPEGPPGTPKRYIEMIDYKAP